MVAHHHAFGHRRDHRAVAVLAGLQCGIGALALADVVKKDRDAAARRVDAVLEPAIVGRVVLLDKHIAAFAHGLLVGMIEGLAHAFGKLGPDMLADEFVAAAPEDLRGVFVHVGVAPIPVERHEGIADALEDVCNLFAGGLGRRLHLLALGQVGNGANHAQCAAGGIATDDFAARQDPFRTAVLAQHAVLDNVMVGAAVEVRLPGCRYLGYIFRINAFLGLIDMIANLEIGITEYFFPAVGKHGFAGHDIPVPHAVAGAFKCELPALFIFGNHVFTIAADIKHAIELLAHRFYFRRARQPGARRRIAGRHFFGSGGKFADRLDDGGRNPPCHRQGQQQRNAGNRHAAQQHRTVGCEYFLLRHAGQHAPTGTGHGHIGKQAPHPIHPDCRIDALALAADGGGGFGEQRFADPERRIGRTQ